MSRCNWGSVYHGGTSSWPILIGKHVPWFSVPPGMKFSLHALQTLWSFNSKLPDGLWFFSFFWEGIKLYSPPLLYTDNALWASWLRSTWCHRKSKALWGSIYNSSGCHEIQFITPSACNITLENFKWPSGILSTEEASRLLSGGIGRQGSCFPSETLHCKTWLSHESSGIRSGMIVCHHRQVIQRRFSSREVMKYHRPIGC